MIPVFCERRLIGFLSIALEDWDKSPKRIYSFERFPSMRRVGDYGANRPLNRITIEAATIFDSRSRAIALDVKDETTFTGWAAFTPLSGWEAPGAYIREG